MSARKNFYFRQRVTEAELDAAFDDLELADHNLAGDLGFTGVLANAVVSQHAPVPDLTVDVSGPASILDPQGRRVFFSSLQNVSLAQDDNGVATAVSAAGKEKVLSVFIRFDRLLSDPRVDGNSATVFFRADESFKFDVVQGVEAAAGGAIPPPLRADAILLADVTRQFGQAQVANNVISAARRQDAFVVAGAPRSLRRGRTSEAIADLLGFYNAHVGGTTDRHAGGAIDYNGGPSWADGVTNPATTVESQLDKILSELAAGGGAAKLGATATDGAPTTLAAGSVKSQLDELLVSLNAHVVDASGAHAASAIAYAGGGAWKDGSGNPATTVEAQLDKLVADLSADAGAARVGAAARASWLDNTANPAGVSLFAALNKVITDLSAQVAQGDGAARIGARAAGHLVAGSVRSQLDALDATSVRTDVANVFAASQTVNGEAGDTSSALVTTSPIGTRKLLWQIAGPSYGYRLYATRSTFELTLNAAWDGAQWVKDAAAVGSSKLELNTTELRLNADEALATPFADTWPNTIGLGFPSHGRQSFDAGGNWTSPGATDTYIGWRGTSGNTAQPVGAGAPFRKLFPVTPSSITFEVLATQNLQSPPTALLATPGGLGASANVVSPNSPTFFFTRVIAS